MNKKKVFIFSVIIITTVVGLYFSINKKNYENRNTTELVLTPVSDWLLYTNTKYNYVLKYPKNIYIQPVFEEERLPVEESSSIEIFSPGSKDGGIRILTWELYTYKTVDKESLDYNKEHNRITSLDLKSFSEIMRQKEVDDKNPNFPNKTVSELKEIDFAGQKAYEVTVSGYPDSLGSEHFKRIYLNDGNDKKIILQYSLDGNLSKQIIDTFGFTK